MPERDEASGERRQGALETARALGELTAQIRAMQERADSAQSDLVRSNADQAAQMHEVKHDLRNTATILTAFDQRLKGYDLAVQENRARTAEQFVEIRAEIRTQHGALSSQIQDIKTTGARTSAQISDLMLWRNKMLGGLALVGLILVMFRQQISDLFLHAFTSK